ncbi:MAG: PDZ domain-containing protein [Deltaproteobacteria bacterium]|nr:PDZ domain-containing protein [Deltaproteobacteria bacterium]
MISERLKYLNVGLALLAFPLLGLLAKDILVLKFRPALKAAETGPAIQAPADAPFESYAPILEKGAFPSASRQLVKIDILDEGAAAASHPVLTELRLLGTYSGPVSFAVFEKTGSAEQDVFSAGQSVFNAGTLIAIEDGKARLSAGGSEVTFTVFKEEVPSSISGMGEPVELPDTPDGQAANTGSRYTEKVAENSWVIDQKAVENSLNDMSRVMTDARLTPKTSGGRVQGFLVTEIKPRGIFDAIGLKNGDVLTKINGYDIDSPEKAVQVLSAMRGQTSIDLDILRAGKPASLHYTIR